MSKLTEYQNSVYHYVTSDQLDNLSEKNPIPAMSLVGHAADILKLFRNSIRLNKQLGETRRDSMRDLLSQLFYQLTCICLQYGFSLEDIVSLSQEHVRQKLRIRQIRQNQPINENQSTP